MNEDAKRRTVVLAEDSMVQRMAMSAWLEEHSYQVRSAADGFEALRLVDYGGAIADVVVTDIGMPQLNGLNLCRRIKGNPKTRHVPVIMLTSLWSEKNQKAAAEAGASECLRKPVDEVELISRVDALCAAADLGEPRGSWHEMIFDAVCEAILVMDDGGRCIDANRAAQQALGRSRDELLASGTAAPVFQPDAWAELAPQLAELHEWRGQLRLRHKDGEPLPMEVRARAELFGGKQIYVLLLLASSPSPSPAPASTAPRLDIVPHDTRDVVDAGKLYQVLGLPTKDPKMLTPDENNRLLRFQEAVKNATAVGRIHRYERRKRDTGELIGYGYLRRELEHIVRNRG